MKYLKGYRFKAIISIFAKLLEAVFELILPLLMVELINEGIDNPHYKITLLKMLALVVGGYMSTLLCQFWASQVSQGVGGRVRELLFAHVQTFSQADYDIFSTASLTNRISVDSNQFQLMVAMVIRLVSRAPILIVGSIIALYTISPDLAWVLLGAFPVFLGIIALFMYISLIRNKRTQIKLDRLINKAKESITGVRVIRAFGKSEYFKNSFENANEELVDTQKKAVFINAISSPTITYIMNGVLLILIYLGIINISEGTMQNSELIAVINYCTQLVLALVVVSNLVMLFSRGFTSLSRINEVMDHQTLVPNTGQKSLDSKDLYIQFKAVDFSYPGQRRKVLKNINMDIEPGDKIGIIGLTGSGKSTLVQLIPRLYEVTSGSIEINGVPLQEYDLKSLRSKIGYIDQIPQFIENTLYENINMIGGEKEASILLDHASGSDILEKGLNSTIKERGSNLSGGQRQRINIARALAKEAEVLVFDDTFSALDNLTHQRIRETLAREYKDKTQIIISQNTTTFMNMDKIYVLVDGTIDAVGTHEELLVSTPLYAKIDALVREEA